MNSIGRPACIALGILLGLLTACMEGPAQAQAPGLPYPYTPSGRKPAVSPYINLLRPGTDPAINYYGLVRPEISFTNSLAQLQGQQASLASQQQQQELGAYSSLPPTGHATGFMTQGRYFMRPASGGVQGTTFIKSAAAPPPKGPSVRPRP